MKVREGIVSLEGAEQFTGLAIGAAWVESFFQFHVDKKVYRLAPQRDLTAYELYEITRLQQFAGHNTHHSDLPKMLFGRVVERGLERHFEVSDA